MSNRDAPYWVHSDPEPAPVQRSERPALCLARTCRPAEHGGKRTTAHDCALCSVCRDRVSSDMDDIANDWADLQDRLAVGGSKAGQPVSGSKIPGLVLNEKASDAASAVTAWVWFLIRMIIDERTDRHVQLPKDQDTPTLLVWIAERHALWLAEHPDNELAASIAEEASHLRKKVHKAAFPSGARVVEFCPCPEHATTTEGERVPCDGMIRALIAHADDQLPPAVGCNGTLEEHKWTPSQWHALARKLAIAAPNADAAAHFLRQISA